MSVHRVVAVEPIARAQRRGFGETLRRRVQLVWTYSPNTDRQFLASFAPSMADQPAFVQTVFDDIREHREQQVVVTVQECAQGFP